MNPIPPIDDGFDRPQVEEVFAAARELPAPERTVFLEHACRGDPALRRRVEELLFAADRADAILETPPLASTRQIDGEFDHEHRVGRRIGSYRLVRVIGSGGMASVWLAERADEQFHKLVAVKLIKRGMDTDEIIRRFRRERQVLAALEHPHIARLIDGGVTEDGLPYLVEEYVPGAPIDQYCDENQLTVRQRLELFQSVCAAVQYAHLNLIVHRDLKPANVLVVSEQGQGKDGLVDASTGPAARPPVTGPVCSPQPKLLDFGIAKLLDAESVVHASVLTLAEARPMTPAYASPEQITGEPVTTATDVYALGVVLYQLLAGKLPYGAAGGGRPLTDAILHGQPDRLAGGGHNRPRCPGVIDGEIETIVLKCLSKERERRYQNAGELARDIDHYLCGEPIEAKRDSTLYVLRKFVRRNRVLVGAVASLFLALVGGIAGTTWQAVVADRARARADSEAAVARAVSAFFIDDMLGSADLANITLELTLYDLLERATQAVDERMVGLPLVEASIRRTLGNSYVGLGIYDQAEEHLTRALQLRQQSLGDEHRDTVVSLNDLARLYSWQRRSAEARQLTAQAASAAENLLADDDDDSLACQRRLAWHDWMAGRGEEAESRLRRVFQAERRRRGSDHRDALLAQSDLALAAALGGTDASRAPRLAAAFHRAGLDAEAERTYLDAIEWERSVKGEDHLVLLNLQRELAVQYRNLGRYSEAESVLNGVWECSRRNLSARNAITLPCVVQLADLYSVWRRYPDAERILLGYLEVSGDEATADEARRSVQQRLIHLYEAWGKPEQVAPLRARLASVPCTAKN
jgi:serine/threonine-protein kinase